MPLDTAVRIVAVLGVILVVYSQFVEAEHRRDLIRLVGAAATLIYALSIGNWIFIALAGGIGLAALIEFIEIAAGRHTHVPIDVKTDRPIK